MKGTKNILILLTFIFVGLNTKAQQDPMYSMYMFDKMVINPAYTGSADWAVGTLKHRQQFAGMENGASTQTLNYHMPIGRRHVGLGLKVINDKIAIVNNLNASLSYSYHLNFAGGKLSLGLETGMYSRTIDYSQLFLITQNDDAIPNVVSKSIVPDASWGLFYRKKGYYIGISQNHMIPFKMQDDLLIPSNSKLYSHFNIMMGTEFDFKNKLSLEPSLLLKSVAGAPVQLDVNALLYYDDRFAVGANVRTGDAVGLIFRANLTESFKVSYSYDITTSKLSTFSSGAHEILVSYGVKLPPPPSEKEIHPRYYF